MKKLLFFLLISLSSILQSQVIFKPYLETGFEDRSICFLNNYRLHNTFRNSYFGKLYMGLEYKKFNLYISDKTYFKPDNLFSYDPKQIEYSLGASFNFKYITLKYSHFCSHTIESILFNDAYDRFSIRINFY